MPSVTVSEMGRQLVRSTTWENHVMSVRYRSGHGKRQSACCTQGCPSGKGSRGTNNGDDAANCNQAIAMSPREVICEQCGSKVTADNNGLCPECGYYLKWSRPTSEEEEEARTPRRPGEEVIEPPTPEIVEPPPRAEDTQEIGLPPILCPSCRTPNPPSRTLCLSCANVLREETAPAHTDPRPSPTPRRRRELPLGVVVGCSLLLGLVVFGVLANLQGWPPFSESADAAESATPTPTPTPSQKPSQPPPPVAPVDPATVGVEASSVLPATNDNTYEPTNTLDGDPATAWNDGAEGTGAGEILTYTFSQPVDVVRLEVINGYAKDDRIWNGNARIREATVTTDAGSFPIELVDSPEQQSVRRDFGRTSTLALRVDSVYPGDRWTDLGLSEIEFWHQPPASPAPSEQPS